jgi:hypothetical protein
MVPRTEVSDDCPKAPTEPITNASAATRHKEPICRLRIDPHESRGLFSRRHTGKSFLLICQRSLAAKFASFPCRPGIESRKGHLCCDELNPASDK